MQHLGKAYFAAEDYVSAGNCFERALNLRTAAGADQALVESSRRALRRARVLNRRNTEQHPVTGAVATRGRGR